MAPTCWPEHPDFVNDAERDAWRALRRQLRDGDVLLHGLRFSDPVDGEVEIDLLVLMPDKGAAVIEVKGGQITYAEGQVWQVRGDGRHRIDPAEQAAKEMRALQRFLERQPDWSRGSLRATWLVAFPNTRVAGDLGPRLRRDIVIGESDLEDAAGKVFDRLADPSLERWTARPGWVQSALDHLLGTYNPDVEIQGRMAERLKRVDQLTAGQSALLAVIRNLRRFEVTGPAGSGKTWLATQQARRWAASGERVAYLSYTRGVVELIRRSMVDLPADEQPAWIGTYFLLAAQWGIRPVDNDDIDFWNRRGPQEMLTHAQRLADADKFTALVVDEAQDFADSWWPALLAASTPEAKVAVFRDDQQAVFTQRRGRPDIDLVPLVLDENLRNASEIVETFRHLVDGEIASRSGSGFPLEYVRCTPNAVVEVTDDVVADLVDKRGWLPEHVVVLTTQHRHPVQKEYQDKQAYWSDLWESDGVFYSTVAGFKGLERPAVVLMVDGFHDDLDPHHVLYTGMSRARDLLIVVGPEDLLAQVGGRKLHRRLLHHERVLQQDSSD
ncbi:MAG: NERD domain-containing protein [Actinomycetales bacterium]|nr:NERD domain-containing protein [Actinomycetales bacterium]